MSHSLGMPFVRALVFGAWCSGVAGGIAAQTAVETPRTIRVVVDGAYAPYAYQSDEGDLQGILVDQWRAWERTTGIKAELQGMDWDQALQRMRAGEFDVIDCIVETAERLDYLDFTPAYATIEASIYFRNDISGIPDLASLKGFLVGVKAGDQHVEKLKANGVTTLILYRNNEAIIEAAKAHTINVFVVDDPSALYLLNKMGIEAEFRHSAPVFRDELRRAVRKGDAATLRTVSAGFAAIKPRELKQIDEKWFGRTIDAYRRYLSVAAYAATVVILLIAGLVGWNRALRKGILQRTAALDQAGDALRQSAEELRAMSRRLVELQESERRDIARELHDRVGQTLTAMRINMDMIRTLLARHDDAVIRGRNDDSLELIESAFKAVENVMYDLRPPMIDEYGLIASLQWYAKKFTDRTGIRVEVRGDENWRCGPEVEIALFRIAQEGRRRGIRPRARPP